MPPKSSRYHWPGPLESPMPKARNVTNPWITTLCHTSAGVTIVGAAPKHWTKIKTCNYCQGWRLPRNWGLLCLLQLFFSFGILRGACLLQQPEKIVSIIKTGVFERGAMTHPPKKFHCFCRLLPPLGQTQHTLESLAHSLLQTQSIQNSLPHPKSVSTCHGWIWNLRRTNGLVN